ncbi:MAG: arginine--tRNA ligase [Candidatus Liptonbacteria bacterium RIFCSPLOWO2_01_FULL_56_20]|uniref:Arginine--tRNA ligase n=1 Tax=Candidatus Liptonbacteria bacterium RIFCSPLOWO2_01_FULL_56_20 TaxID=1798652 RepID=A0A1G2CHY3_9BACT|nr:MAG: arginine--tRNA ligase [Candidatus Liptonbacteria bacterium RIFCSPHIGHO2_01_FULL_56_18b]OGZ00822.1 MAG: arginine--tRNA ligase [Candidatus Liptonbacteria bacterium RIFCSPLOWO2_01_FULL_56_20]
MLQTRIRIIVRNAVPANIEFDVLVPEKSAFGHYATNVALRMAKHERKDPIKLGHELATKIRERAPQGFFARVEVAPPGFINFWLSPHAFALVVGEIVKQKSRYGSSRLGKGKKTQVEYVSANPTGPLTLANGRGGFLGDAIANALKFAGYTVEREYYVNDTGGQIETLGRSILAFAGYVPEEDHFYKGAYLKDWEKKHRAVAKRYAKDPLRLGQRAARDFLGAIKSVLAKEARIRFDRFTSEEGHIHKKGFVKKALALFERKKLAYEKEGAVWLRTTAFGDDKDRVLVTREGSPTYLLADSGHYLETKTRGFHGKINILGPDHYGYVKRIQAAAAIVGLDNSEVIITQAVRLVRNGKEAKMSKRKGEFATFKELIRDVGSDAARFFFLMIAPETHMDFDLALAKEHSMKNPVYYAQYAAVRARAILKKLGKQPVLSNEKLAALLVTEDDARLMAMLARFPEVLEEATRTRRIHELTRYASDLAATFHNFYEKERVIEEEKDVRAARGTLVSAASIVFTNLFGILGIATPKKM